MARRAEKIYTKMGIRRDESEDLGRKKKDTAPSAYSAWDDTTEVSLLALRGFLEDLLGIGHASSLPLEPPTTMISPPLSPPSSAPVSLPVPTAYAVHAYQVTGKAVHDENVAGFSSPPPAPGESASSAFQLGDDFGEAERETLRGYIRDLTLLESRGIETLTLQRNLTFLDSIRQAIAAAK